MWANVGSEFRFHSGKPAGRQFICEASDLRPVGSSTYDCVLSCHCLEHVANPLRALGEWKRVLKQGGLLLLILPDRDGTSDSQRPVTSIEHIKRDFARNVGEDDMTHLEENATESSREMCLQNYRYRMMHHHVFDTQTAVAMLHCAGFQVLRAETAKPFHIVILAMNLVA